MDWAGRWLQRNDEGGFVLRKLNLHRYIDGTESDEMPSTWQVTPDFRYAVVSRVKGTPDWPVIDLDTKKVVNRIEVPGWKEPRLAFDRDGGAWIGVRDQLHRLASIHGQMSGGTRLKSDNSGSSIAELRLESGSSLLITWVGRGEASVMRDVSGIKDVVKLQADPLATVKSLAAASKVRWGAVLRWDTSSGLVAEVARFPKWVSDPHVCGESLLAQVWGQGDVLRSRFEDEHWPTFPPRAAGEKMW